MFLRVLFSSCHLRRATVSPGFERFDEVFALTATESLGNGLNRDSFHALHTLLHLMMLGFLARAHPQPSAWFRVCVSFQTSENSCFPVQPLAYCSKGASEIRADLQPLDFWEGGLDVSCVVKAIPWRLLGFVLDSHGMTAHVDLSCLSVESPRPEFAAFFEEGNRHHPLTLS